MKNQIKIPGKRVFLRDYKETDRDFYHSWINDPVIMKYLDWKTTSRQESDRNFDYCLAQQHTKNRKDFYFGLGLTEAKHLIGNAGISIIGDEPMTGEIGWILKPEYRGQGYTTEAGELLIKFGRESLHLKKVFATCDKENVASEAIMQRLGMTKKREIAHTSIHTKIKLRYDLELDSQSD